MTKDDGVFTVICTWNAAQFFIYPPPPSPKIYWPDLLVGRSMGRSRVSYPNPTYLIAILYALQKIYRLLPEIQPTQENLLVTS